MPTLVSIFRAVGVFIPQPSARIWVTLGGFGSHPCRLVSISYRLTLDCHGRGREFESRRPHDSPKQWGGITKNREGDYGQDSSRHIDLQVEVRRYKYSLNGRLLSEQTLNQRPRVLQGLNASQQAQMNRGQKLDPAPAIPTEWRFSSTTCPHS
jgi:hypothetical protein